MERIAIGMSGGVDSSVAAAILKEQGYDVVGITMRLWDGEDIPEKDAKAVAKKLGIEHHFVDMRDEFSKIVVDYFTAEYLKGRTPNPCIVCNKYLKFDAMFKAAEEFGCTKLATGHYAKVEFDENRKRYILSCADSKKDQTYALYLLSQEQLSRTVMPLGEFASKEEVREKARELGFEIADKADSMEICFIPDKDYVSFIKKRTNACMPSGDFVDTDGNVLGKHQGIINYTIGQRKGLGIAFGKPMFVTKIDAEKNQVVLGVSGEEFSQKLVCRDLNFISIEAPKQPFYAEAKIRYSAPKAMAKLTPIGEEMLVEFEKPQRAVTPGQAVVFYEPDSNIVMGGGTIDRQEGK